MHRPFYCVKNIFNLIACFTNGINELKHESVQIVLENFRSNTFTHKAPVQNTTLKKVAWQRCTDQDIQLYKAYLDNELCNINVSHDVLTCRNILCKNKEHTGIIINLFNKFEQSCVIASNKALPHTKPSDTTPPFWNEIAEPYKKGLILALDMG